jgi:alpha-L-fucosidase
MNRRDFLFTNAAALYAAQERASASNPQDHHLPATDRHYQRVKSYIEDTPVSNYRWASSQAYEAFRDMKFGVRIHWGIYSVAGYDKESWPFLSKSFSERQQYNQIYKTWNPTAFDADAWMSLFTDSGLKMFAFTTKHHEGFSMFDTKTRVHSRANWTAPGGPKMEACDLAYSIMETPFRRDIVGEICHAAHKRNLKIALYFSHPDWYDADFRPYVYHPLQVPSSSALDIDFNETKKRLDGRIVIVPDPTPAEVRRMLARHRAQLTELLTRYGRIDMLSLDMWLGRTVWPELRQTILDLRKLQPDVMLRARGIGNYGDYYTPEGFVPGSKENTNTPWMVIYPLAHGFSYDPDPTHYKGTGWIVGNLVDTVAKGGSFQVGVGPDATGRFHPLAVEQLKETGRWLRVNGEGIYATRPRDGSLWAEGSDVRFSRTKDRRYIYAFAQKWPGQTFTLTSVRAKRGSKIQLLGTPEALAWRNDPVRGLVIDIPANLQDASRRPCKYSYCFRIEGIDEPAKRS